MIRFTKPLLAKLATGLLGCTFLAGPVAAINYEDLMKLKEQFQIVRDLVRKLRGNQPAPTAPQPPAQTPAPSPTTPAPTTPAPDSPPAPTPGPIPAITGGMTFKGNCTGRDETGYAENAQLTITNGQVSQMEVKIDVPKRGACRYQLAAFKQTKSSPFVELIAKSNSYCAVRVWQQGDRVTLAATDCADKCPAGTFDYAWPVAFQTSGGCH